MSRRVTDPYRTTRRRADTLEAKLTKWISECRDDKCDKCRCYRQIRASVRTARRLMAWDLELRQLKAVELESRRVRSASSDRG